MKKLLVLCTGNSCRSQMAHGYFNHLAGNYCETYSAGIVAHGVNPYAIAVMREDGIDISGYQSNTVEEYRGMKFDFVITVCDNAHDNCPVFPGGTQMFHQNFPDPAKVTGTEQEILAAFRAVRDQIKEYCRRFVQQYIMPEGGGQS